MDFLNDFDKDEPEFTFRERVLILFLLPIVLFDIFIITPLIAYLNK